MKYIVFIFFALGFYALSNGIAATKLDSNGILRDDDGNILFMNHSDAMRACPRGTHLATARELAVMSHANGAKGILEIGQIKNRVPVGYYLVESIDPGGKQDKFYFSFEGQVWPSALPKEIWIWSSSRILNSNDYKYYLYGYLGNGFKYNRANNFNNAVYCSSVSTAEK